MRRMILVLGLVVAMQSAMIARAAEPEKQVLPDNHVITLVMTFADGKNQNFNHVFAGSWFTVSYAEPFLSFKGEMKPADGGRMLLNYEIWITDSHKDADGSKKAVGSGCKGQVFLRQDVPVTVSYGGKRSYTLILSTEKKK